MAISFTVRLEPEFPSLQLGFFQRLRDIVARAKVHLVRRLPLERRVWQMAVVLIDVECDQLPHAGRSVQGVQEQPLMLNHSPP